MKPDWGNEPLTAAEFLKLPEKLILNEYWRVVREGVVHEEYTISGSWTDTLTSIFPDNTVKVIGYIGEKTGIRLCVACGEVLEGPHTGTK